MTEKIGMLLYDDVQPMDVIGPWEVLSFWKNQLHTPIEMYLISQRGDWVQCDNHITLQSHHSFDTCPPLDYLIVPGGRGRLQEVNNEALINFIKREAARCKYVLSVCTGTFLLRQAGLLTNQSVTTYWRALPELRAFNDLHIEEKRIVKNGKLWFSGGVSSGIDLALELIAEIAGKDTAGKVQLLFEYFPRDTVYSKEDMTQDLPTYSGVKAQLPAYIRDYIHKKKP